MEAGWNGTPNTYVTSGDSDTPPRQDRWGLQQDMRLPCITEY